MHPEDMEFDIVERPMRGYSPMELEAIAKMARTVKSLNEILIEDPESVLEIRWKAVQDDTSLAGQLEDGLVFFRS